MLACLARVARACTRAFVASIVIVSGRPIGEDKSQRSVAKDASKI